MSYSDNPILSISSNNIKNCENVANLMLNLGIISKITKNYSIVRSDGNIIKEHGCDIKFTSFKNKQQIIKSWDNLKEKYNLTCAYLEIPNKFSGCIYNYINPPECPFLKPTND